MLSMTAASREKYYFYFSFINEVNKAFRCAATDV